MPSHQFFSVGALLAITLSPSYALGPQPHKKSHQPAASVQSQKDSAFMGIFLQGQKIGDLTFVSIPARYKGKKAKLELSTMRISAQMLGTPFEISEVSTGYYDENDIPYEEFDKESSKGRVQRFHALYKPQTIEVSISNGGKVDHKSIKFPRTRLGSDPISAALGSKFHLKKETVSYCLDSSTATIVETKTKYLGLEKIDAGGKSVRAYHFQFNYQGNNMDAFTTKAGDPVKIVMPMGMTCVPEPESVAKSPLKMVALDIAEGTKIAPTGDVGNPAQWKSATITVSGSRLPLFPSDDQQTATVDGKVATIQLHPQEFPTESAPLAGLAADSSPWTKPDLHVPSNQARFVKLAKKITAGKTKVAEAARAIQLWVNHVMQPDAGIAILRDANEVLDSKRGVCRDYAILTATLLRSIHIPTKMATGLVDWDGDFYYHAWVLFYDGDKWVGLDSTTDDEEFSASHVELACGTVSQAFAAPILEDPKVAVVTEKE